MALSKDQIVDGIASLPDRYVPRFQVYLAKPKLTRNPLALSIGPEVPMDPDAAKADEKKRLDGSIFASTGEIGAPPPKLSQLIPLAGPWGEKADQHTDDILSVEFTESIDKQQLATVKVEVLNAYDAARQFYRYTDIPRNLSADQAGVYPIIDYGDTLALRFGYGAEVDWVFEGIVTTIEVSFPADGNSVVTLTAVDKRDRLRSQKKVDLKTTGKATEEQIIAQVIKQAGLRIAAPRNQKTPTQAGGRKPADQDALQFITDHANKSSLELLCFGDTLFAYQPGDEASSALRYEYRAGLSSFTPTFNGVGKATQVRVVSQDPSSGKPVDVTVGTKDLQDMGLVPSSSEGKGEGGDKGDTAADTVAKAGQGGEKTEVVTNYLALTPDQAQRLAAGILKRNVDATLTVTGEMIGDPRVRPRVTLMIEGVGRFNGFYYVTSATHRLGPNGYQTSFNARRNSALSGQGSAAAGGSSD